MITKFALALGAALSVGVLAAGSAQAGPTPHWFSDGMLISGNPVPVKTSGKLEFDFTQFGVTVTCKVADAETIQNPASGGPGTDELTAFRVSMCKESRGAPAPLCKAPTKMEVVALGLPWKSHLVSEAPVVRDVIEGVVLEFKCTKGGMNYGPYTGTLSPKVGNSVLEFEGGAGLSGTFGTVLVKGKDKMTGPKGDKKITAE